MNIRKKIVLVLLVLGVLLLSFIFIPVETVIAERERQEPSNSCLVRDHVDAISFCQHLEHALLQSTVRYQIDYWFVKPDESGYLYDTAIGHGTVKDGRYLVTHNHFGEPFTNQPAIDTQAIYQQIKIYNAYGELLAKLPRQELSIVVQEQQTLVIDFGEEAGQGFFANLGLLSADFRDAQTRPPQIGAEVAQIDWDGSTARVDWTTIQNIEEDNGVITLIMADNIKKGASGGGVFSQAVHIGNNWKTAPLGQISTAALNTGSISQ